MRIRTNAKQFAEKLRFTGEQGIPDQTSLLQRAIALRVLRSVVLRTPVDTGRARGNWDVYLGEVLVRAPSENTDKSGTSTISEGSLAISDAKPFDRIHIENNVVYILRLEHGSSSQAPNGMVSVTLASLGAVKLGRGEAL